MSSASNNLRKIFSDILRGYSLVDSQFGRIYIKHFNNLDLSSIDNIHNVYLEEAKSRGVFTYEDRLDFLIKNNLWEEKDELKIKDYKNLIAQYETNKSNEFLKSKRDVWTAQLDQLNKDIKDLELKKYNLLGDTAESLAYRRSNLLHIKESFFKNGELNIKLFSEEEFEEFSSQEIEKLYDIFTAYLNDLSQENIKKISLSSFFMNIFNLTESIYEFYGKPIIHLSLYQADLAAYGRYFKHVLGEMKTKLPNDILNDPDKIIEYVELNRNYEKMFPDDGKDKEGGSVAIPGAKKEDLAVLGLKADGNDKFNEMLKKKGSLKSEDIFKMMDG